MRGRPREFDREEALGRAVHLFWQQGFEATGIAELTEVMGIGRQSLYSTFGDKRQLFLAALQAYGQTQTAEIRSFLDAPGSPLQNIRDLFAHLRGRAQEEDFYGCLINNSLAEIGLRDEEIGDFLRGYITQAEGLFRRTLERAAEAGELRPGIDPQRQARTLVNTIQGLALMAKIRMPGEMLDDIIASSLAALEKGEGE